MSVKEEIREMGNHLQTAFASLNEALEILKYSENIDYPYLGIDLNNAREDIGRIIAHVKIIDQQLWVRSIF